MAQQIETWPELESVELSLGFGADINSLLTILLAALSRTGAALGRLFLRVDSDDATQSFDHTVFDMLMDPKGSLTIFQKVEPRERREDPRTCRPGSGCCAKKPPPDVPSFVVSGSQQRAHIHGVYQLLQDEHRCADPDDEGIHPVLFNGAPIYDNHRVGEERKCIFWHPASAEPVAGDAAEPGSKDAAEQNKGDINRKKFQKLRTQGGSEKIHGKWVIATKYAELLLKQLRKTVEQAGDKQGGENDAADDFDLGSEGNRGKVEQLVRALFDRTDTDHDAILSHQELDDMLDRPGGSAFGRSLTKKERLELISYIDSNNDGKISRGEFVKALMIHRETYIHASSEIMEVEFVAGEQGKKIDQDVEVDEQR
eukprot:SAG11_NODE_3548_length_2377_cov_1.137840_2_plen_369_part_00